MDNDTKPNSKVKPARARNSKSRKVNRKNISDRGLENLSKYDDANKGPPEDTNCNDQKAGSKGQKYFIMVEETSSKGTENLIFLVEEKPVQLNQRLKRRLSSSMERSRLESRKTSVIQSKRMSNRSLITSNAQNSLDENESQITFPVVNGDTQIDTVICLLSTTIWFNYVLYISIISTNLIVNFQKLFFRKF